ncbi:MAG: DoxX family membrane protein [Bacteroidota bacterium]
MKNFTDLLGRIFLGFIFLYEAYDSMFYFKDTTDEMIYYGLSWNTEWQLVGGIILLMLGGILLLIGYRVQFAVLLLLAYWIPVTFIVHSFWNDPVDCLVNYPCIDLSENYRRIQSILFMKNLAIIGGLLMVFSNGTQRYSVKKLFATARVPGT